MPKTSKKKEKEFPYKLRLHDIGNNFSQTVRFNQKGIELWYELARRGYVCLIWDSGINGGYYYKLSELKKGLQKLWDEGLIKEGGYFYEKTYYA